MQFAVCATTYTRFLRAYKVSISKLHYPCQSLLDRMVEILERYGKIKIHLAELIEETGISKNKLSQRAEMQRTQLNHYCNNTVTRLDVDVLARLCTVLDCEIGDLLEFVPPEQ